MNYLLFVSFISYLSTPIAISERYFPTKVHAFSLPVTFPAYSFWNNTENLKKAEPTLQFRFTFPANTLKQETKKAQQTVKGLTT